MASLQTIGQRVLDGSPYPMISPSGELADGMLVRQPDVCRACRPRKCAALYAATDNLLHATCYRGIGVAVVGIAGSPAVLNGLRLDVERTKLSRSLKKQIASQHVCREDVERWYARASALANALMREVESGISDSVSMFHDVQTAVNAILRNAETLISELPGWSEDDKLSKLPQSATSMIKGAELLQRRLALMPLVVNPAAASFGVRRPLAIYRLVDVLVRTLRATSGPRVQLRLNGPSFRTPEVFASFDTIPLVLLENAIKYSQQGQEVEIEVLDTGAANVTVRVKSFSPWVPPEERSKLFDKGFRGSNAHQVVTQGSGLGLYLARVVADAHGFSIKHQSDDLDVGIGGVRYCNNEFFFVVPPRAGMQG